MLRTSVGATVWRSRGSVTIAARLVWASGYRLCTAGDNRKDIDSRRRTLYRE